MRGNHNTGWIIAGVGAAAAGLGTVLLRERLKDKAVGRGARRKASGDEL
jgi:hypothetical protein